MENFVSKVVLDDPAFIHPTAQIYGKVHIKEGASLWPNSVIRSEVYEVVIGERTNIQDFVMIHVGKMTGTYIGKNCSITHHCTLYGCKVGDNCLIGINSTIMDGCKIGNNCIIGEHTLLSKGTIIPDNSIVMGCPGDVVKTKNNYADNKLSALLYYRNALAYNKGNHREWSDPNIFDVITKEITQLQKEQDSMNEE
jgi:carbonic anhydrase/acetyltransferase-like protein (isoleucine patch superfamily)